MECIHAKIWISKNASLCRVLQIRSHMAFKFFPDTILLLNVDRFEGILNRIKIDVILNDHLGSCKS